jgi:superfamily II DNA/RNA helicase
MTLEEKETVANDFKEGKFQVLITTNVLSRGIDWRRVTLVVNFLLPRTYPKMDVDKQTYIHRIGRTGRFGDFGVALNLIERESDIADIKAISDEYVMEISELKNIKDIKPHIDEVLALRFISTKAEFIVDTTTKEEFRNRLIYYYETIINEWKKQRILLYVQDEEQGKIIF